MLSTAAAATENGTNGLIGVIHSLFVGTAPPANDVIIIDYEEKRL